MPKPFLKQEDAILEHQVIETLQAGLKVWRSDLDYPESYSDMQACVRGLLQMFEVKRRPLMVPLRVECHVCRGLGELVNKVEGNVRYLSECSKCDRRGYLETWR